MAEVEDRRAKTVQPAVEEQEKLPPELVGSQLVLLVRSLTDALPDDTVVFARRALDAQDNLSAAAAILFGALQYRVPFTAAEYAVLAEIMVALNEDLGMLDYLSITEEARPVLFEFVPGPQALRDASIDASPEAALESSNDAQAEAVDEVVLPNVVSDPAVLGVWRAWRYPVTGAPWPPPRPVYLMEVCDEAGAAAVSGRFYGALAGPIGERDPLVEVYVTGEDLPPLHRAIHFAGQLVHAASSGGEFTFADVFEGAPGPDGVPMDIVRMEGAEADRILTYLMAGKPLMIADVNGEDLLDRQRGNVVPLHLRTDGVWVWSEASGYYLSEHAVAPPRVFCDYLSTVGPLPLPVDDVTLHQAVAWLRTG